VLGDDFQQTEIGSVLGGSCTGAFLKVLPDLDWGWDRRTNRSNAVDQVKQFS